MEQRIYPRINVSFPLKIMPNILGETADISETGLSFVLQKPLLLSRASARIELSPKESIETEFKIIWNKHLVEKNGFRYGACFIRLKEKDIGILRDMLIQTHIEAILNKIDNDEKRQKVLEFWTKDFKKYITDFNSVSRDIKNKKISLNDACKKLNVMNNAVLRKSDETELLLDDKKLAKKIKEIFRIMCGPWAYKGNIVKRAFEKPRGYPGDYEVLEAIYDNKSNSEGIGYCCDNYFLKNPYTTAVRNRKNLMKRLLIDSIYNASSPINILNLACGSSREIKEMFSETEISKTSSKKIIFTLVDQDEEALNLSQKILKPYESENVSFRFIKHNILDYVNKEREYSEILDRQDIIYSIGLADYLPDRILKKLILFCLALLKPKGSLILAHKDIKSYRPIATDWWCDWTFYPRGERETIDLLIDCGINGSNIKVLREKSKIIMFFTATKK